MLSAIIGWAEQGKAPDVVIAGVSPANKEVPTDWSPERTRPRRPGPKIARYIDGDKEKAESLACR